MAIAKFTKKFHDKLALSKNIRARKILPKGKAFYGTNSVVKFLPKPVKSQKNAVLLPLDFVLCYF